MKHRDLQLGPRRTFSFLIISFTFTNIQNFRSIKLPWKRLTMQCRYLVQAAKKRMKKKTSRKMQRCCGKFPPPCFPGFAGAGRSQYQIGVSLEYSPFNMRIWLDGVRIRFGSPLNMRILLLLFFCGSSRGGGGPPALSGDELSEEIVEKFFLRLEEQMHKMIREEVAKVMMDRETELSKMGQKMEELEKKNVTLDCSDVDKNLSTNQTSANRSTGWLVF